MKDIVLRNLVEEDIAEVIKLGDDCKLSNWSFDGYKNELQRNDSIMIVAEVNKQIVGFLTMRLIISSDEGEICNIAVRQKSQRKGIGKKLVESAHSICQISRIWLEVRESNAKAISFYQRNGFVVVGYRKSFYVNPSEDALLMKLEIVRASSYCQKLDRPD